MSVTDIIGHFKEEFARKEPWKAAHDKAIQLLMMEETIGRIANAFDSVIKVDELLHDAAMDVDARHKDARRYAVWKEQASPVLLGAVGVVRDIIRFAERVHYRDYRGVRYTMEDLDVLLNRIRWFANPDEQLGEVLRAGREAELDCEQGRCDGFPEEE